MRVWKLKSAPRRIVLGGAAVLWATASAAGDLRLIMFEEHGCFWCQRWDAEVGVIYDKTPESEVAPLTKVEIDSPLPEGIELAQPAVLTPTFVVVQDGTEVGRITGYPGEDFFWGLLEMIFEKAEVEAAQ